MSAMHDINNQNGDAKGLVVLRDLVSFDAQVVGGRTYAIPRNLKASDSCVLRVVSVDAAKVIA